MQSSAPHSAVAGSRAQNLENYLVANRLEKEMETVQRDLKIVEESHGNQVLNQVLARRYLSKLFAYSRIIRYLGEHHPDILRELQAIREGSSLEN